MTPGVTRTKKTHSTKRMPIQPPAKKPKFETPPPTPTPSPKQFLTLQQANNLKDEISKLDPLDQFRILEILQVGCLYSLIIEAYINCLIQLLFSQTSNNPINKILTVIRQYYEHERIFCHLPTWFD